MGRNVGTRPEMLVKEFPREWRTGKVGFLEYCAGSRGLVRIALRGQKDWRLHFITLRTGPSWLGELVSARCCLLGRQVLAGLWH